ncbi:hypothetical protein GCM10022393_18140 [Aquimarina addita]|uniref:Uncharacterized protein n=1 Tax=Aquimarina addita TaxID=870485 RepID=A0ABP6UH49_9FLAO
MYLEINSKVKMINMLSMKSTKVPNTRINAFVSKKLSDTLNELNVSELSMFK